MAQINLTVRLTIRAGMSVTISVVILVGHKYPIVLHGKTIATE